LKLLDVNVVVAAHRDDHPDYRVARDWLSGTLEAGLPFSVIDAVAGAFLRLVTNPRIFVEPTPLQIAFSYLTALRAQPTHVRLVPGPTHMSLLRDVCLAADARGDLVTDAQLAAVALEHAAHVVSFDRDFARFEQITWELPGKPR
jgi:toxin-antitoxin system PIN domain toxin